MNAYTFSCMLLPGINDPADSYFSTTTAGALATTGAGLATTGATTGAGF